MGCWDHFSSSKSSIPCTEQVVLDLSISCAINEIFYSIG